MEDEAMSCSTEANEGELEMEEEVNDDVDWEKEVSPGYRFKPRDHEIIEQYLMARVHNERYPRNVVYEVEFYKHDPEYFAEKLRAMDGKAWYFFTPRNRKYKTGERPDRSAGGGFWKASGKEEDINHEGKLIGYKRALVFWKGKGSAAEKTNWLMHEYTLKDPPQRQRNGPQDMILDDCVLCKMYKNERGEKSKSAVADKNERGEKNKSAVADKNERGEKNKSAVAVQPLHQSAVAFPPLVYGSNTSSNMNPGLQGLNQQNQTANNVIHQTATNQPVASYQDDTSIQNNSNTMNQHAGGQSNFNQYRNQIDLNQHPGGQSNPTVASHQDDTSTQNNSNTMNQNDAAAAFRAFNQHAGGRTNAFLHPNQIDLNQQPTHISYHPDPPEPTTSQSSENTVKLVEQPSP